jgi:alpha-methylacyl-CoA racemase
MHLGKERLLLDLKDPTNQAMAKSLVNSSDALIEGHRPGVMERLGLGPAEFAESNPKLVYGRMTGWGQSGPLAQAAGHDLNYVALTGMLALSAHRNEKPIVPPTVLGDAAGALGLAFGMVCALYEARHSGKGRVVDGAIVDTLSMMGSIMLWIRDSGQINGNSPSIFHDSPFYDVYPCSDGRYITIGALEPPFYKLLLEKIGIDDVDPAKQYDVTTWPDLKARLATLISRHPQRYWCNLLEGTDVCFSPVLSVAEAANHPHNMAREIFSTSADGSLRSRIAPRFLPLSS